MNGSPATVLIRTLSCFAAGWESGTATTNGSRRIVSIQNVCSLRNEGKSDQSNAQWTVEHQLRDPGP